MKKLTSAAEIVEVLGGKDAVAEMCKSTDKAVWNWHGYFDCFPPRTYVVMVQKLEKLGYTAPPYLWKMTGFERPKRAA
jgi:hypothetical protein